MLADALGILSRELDNGSDLLEQMRQQLMGEAEMPPREVQGVGQEFLDGERVNLEGIFRVELIQIRAQS